MAKPQKKAAQGPDYTSWVIRGVVVVVLAVIVILGLKELRIRQDATASHAAVAGLLSSAGEDKAVLKSQVKPLIKGTPKLETVDAKSLNSPTVASAEKYTWPGLLRSHTLTIGYSLGDDPEVEVVEGPK